MADLVASSSNPTVSFQDDSSTDWWRHRGESASQFFLQRYNGTSWATNFSWSSTGQMSKQDLDINKATPKITFTHTSGFGYAITADGTKLTLSEAGTPLMALSSTNIAAMSDVMIAKGTPKLTFDHTSGDDFSLSVSGAGGHLRLYQASASIMDFAIGENASLTHFKIAQNQPHLTLHPDSRPPDMVGENAG